MLLTLKVCKEDEFDNECERTVQIGKKGSRIQETALTKSSHVSYLGLCILPLGA